MDAPVRLLENDKAKVASTEGRFWPRLIRPFRHGAPGVAADQRAEGRAAPRRPVQIAGRVERVQGDPQDCLVIDLSPGGALIQVERPAAVGETVKLRLTENGEFAGTVKWRGPRRMGIKFDHFGGLLPS